MRLIPVRAEFRRPRKTRKDKGRKRTLKGAILSGAKRGAIAGGGQTLLLGAAYGAGVGGAGEVMKGNRGLRVIKGSAAGAAEGVKALTPLAGKAALLGAGLGGGVAAASYLASRRDLKKGRRRRR